MNTHQWNRLAGGCEVLVLAILLLSGVAASPVQAQGWPALERAEYSAVGGGQHDAAVLIGIDDYPFLTPVVGAEANIAAWERWLISGRKVPYSRVMVLKSKGVDRAQVREALALMARQVDRRGTLYVVFVGHGAPAQRAGGATEAHLLLGDTKRSQASFAETGIGVKTDLEAWVQPASAKGAKVVAVLDACFSGKAQGGGDLIEGAQFAALSSLAAPSNLTLLTAASSKDITGPLPGAARPAFSYLVLAALRGWGDGNADGTVTTQEAVDFAAGVMISAQRPERPALSGVDVSLGKSGGEAVPRYRSWLGQAPTAAPVTVVTGADIDLGALARQAEAAQRQAEASRKALAEAEARHETENARQLAEAQSTLQARARADFETIRSFVEQPTAAGRPVLEGFVAKYGAASVNIGGVLHPLSVRELVQVQAALAPNTGAGAGPSGDGLDPRTGIEWRSIPGGRFQMGSDDGDRDERPRRSVLVSGFDLMKTEVTVAQYRRCVDAGRCSAPNTGGHCNWSQPDREDHPINCVDWSQAAAFARWARARLPSEAEWEFAARNGGQEQKFPWGNQAANAELAVSKGAPNTAPVCSKSAGNSAQGVCDLAGNVWEWVADAYGSYSDGSPTGARDNAARYRVFRGGSWSSSAMILRAAGRSRGMPGDRVGNLGFRLAR